MKSVYNRTNFAILATSAKFPLNEIQNCWPLQTLTSVSWWEKKGCFSLEKARGSHVNYA